MQLCVIQVPNVTRTSNYMSAGSACYANHMFTGSACYAN